MIATATWVATSNIAHGMRPNDDPSEVDGGALTALMLMGFDCAMTAIIFHPQLLV